MAGLLGLGGIGGLGGGVPQGLLQNPALSQLFDPTAMRNYQIKRGLMGAGAAMLNPDPHGAPDSFGSAIGRAVGGGTQGYLQGEDDFYKRGMQNVGLMEMQREYDQRDRQTAAMDALIPTLPPEIQSFARAYPQQFGEAYLKAQMNPTEPKYETVTTDQGVFEYEKGKGPGGMTRLGDRPNRNEGEGREFAQEDKLRESYLKQAKPFADLRTNYQRVQAASQDNTGASDIALVYSFMKMLDPTSVVREGEFATAQNAGGVPEQFIAMYNKLLSGERLAPQVRADFVQQAGRQFQQQTESYNATRQTYQELATQYGLDPARVVPDITYGVSIQQPGQGSSLNPDALRQKYGLKPSR